MTIIEHNLTLPTRVNGHTSDRSKIWTTNFQMQYLSDSTHRTPRSGSTHSQGSCEWFMHDCEALWGKLEQILQLKVGCPNWTFNFCHFDAFCLQFAEILSNLQWIKVSSIFYLKLCNIRSLKCHFFLKFLVQFSQKFLGRCHIVSKGAEIFMFISRTISELQWIRVGRWWQKVVLTTVFYRLKPAGKNVGGKKWQKIKSTLSPKAFLFLFKTNPNI